MPANHSFHSFIHCVHPLHFNSFPFMAFMSCIHFISSHLISCHVVHQFQFIFFHFISFYNTGIKIFFIVSSLTNIYLVTIKYKGTISSDLDSFRIEFLIATAAILALLLHHEFNLIEVSWTFSGIYLAGIERKLDNLNFN